MSDQKLVRRVFVSMNAASNLTDEQEALKWGIVDRVKALGYAPEIFAPPPEKRTLGGLAARLGWSFDAVERIMRRCSGHIIIGMPRWRLSAGEDFLPTEYHHYEGALSYTLRLPTLVMADRAIIKRVVFDHGMGRYVLGLPSDYRMAWLDSGAFRNALKDWDDDMRKRRHIFLGYSSSSRGIAHSLKRFVKEDMDASVLDWHDDFAAGDTILSQVKAAAERCSWGIFLFTKDDILEDGQGKAAPRDNVVFEAGYFAHAKGHDRVLIVLESGAKMPADLGGQIYARLDDKSNIQPIESQIRSFLLAEHQDR